MQKKSILNLSILQPSNLNSPPDPTSTAQHNTFEVHRGSPNNVPWDSMINFTANKNSKTPIIFHSSTVASDHKAALKPMMTIMVEGMMEFQSGSSHSKGNATHQAHSQANIRPNIPDDSNIFFILIQSYKIHLFCCFVIFHVWNGMHRWSDDPICTAAVKFLLVNTFWIWNSQSE